MRDREGNRQSRWRDALDSVATVAVIVLTVAVVWALVFRQAPSGALVVAPRPGTRPVPPPLPAEPVSIADAASQGSDRARIALITYSEFKCPYCGVFARDTLPALGTKYVETGKVLIVFRHFPLDALHPFARQAAQAAECAAQQGQFMPLHDAMFSNQAGLDEAKLAADVTALGLNRRSFDDCIIGEAPKRVDDDVASGRTLGVTGTPTFFVGIIQPDRRVKLVQRVSGARPTKDFEAVLDKWLTEVDRGTK